MSNSRRLNERLSIDDNEELMNFLTTDRSAPLWSTYLAFSIPELRRTGTNPPNLALSYITLTASVNPVYLGTPPHLRWLLTLRPPLPEFRSNALFRDVLSLT